jgi:hypothetical protein
MLRFVRAVCGVFFVIQAISFFASVLNLLTLTEINGDPVFLGVNFAFFLIKLAGLLICGFVFFGTRGLLNRMYEKKFGADSSHHVGKWSL